LLSKEEAWTKIDNYMSFCEILSKEISDLLGHQDPEKINKDEKLHFIYFFLRSLHYFSGIKGLTSEQKNNLTKNVSINITITSQLPIAKGVGSSASYLVTVSACLLVSYSMKE